MKKLLGGALVVSAAVLAGAGSAHAATVTPGSGAPASGATVAVGTVVSVSIAPTGCVAGDVLLYDIGPAASPRTVTVDPLPAGPVPATLTVAAGANIVTAVCWTGTAVRAGTSSTYALNGAGAPTTTAAATTTAAPGVRTRITVTGPAAASVSQLVTATVNPANCANGDTTAYRVGKESDGFIASDVYPGPAESAGSFPVTFTPTTAEVWGVSALCIGSDFAIYNDTRATYLVTVTAAAATTTAAPVVTTAAPVVTTAAGSATTPAPVVTTARAATTLVPVTTAASTVAAGVTGGKALPTTGANTGVMIGIAALLLLAGGGVAMTRRRSMI